MKGNTEITLTQVDSHFEYYPPLYHASFTTSESTLSFQSEHYYYIGMTGHIIVNGYSFYIGISEYFSVSEYSKKYEFYEKNEPRIAQYLYADLSKTYRPIEINFRIPTGNELLNAQFPPFDDNCFNKFYSMEFQNEIIINFLELFNITIPLDSYKLTFPSDFSGTINGFSLSNPTISINSNNSTISISLGNHQYINITTTGSYSTKSCLGYAIISSFQIGCKLYNINTCTECFEDFYLDPKVFVNLLKMGKLCR